MGETNLVTIATIGCRIACKGQEGGSTKEVSMRFSDSHHFRKMVAGCCMVAAPLMVLGAFVVSPAIHTDAREQLGSFAAHPDRLFISTLATVVAVALMVGATLGLMHMLRERMSAYGHAGGIMALLGLVSFAVFSGASLLAWQMVGDGIQATDVTAWHGFTHSTGTVVTVAVMSYVGTAGFVVLAAGLWRARVVDWWMAAAIAVGVVAIALATPFESVAVGIAGAAVLMVGLAAVGLMVLRETDAEWEHTPEYHGVAHGMS
jgi:hypothetical protein